MARQKRGGGSGFRGPELRGTLGTLLRTTLQQAGVVRDAARDVLERGAREGRSRLDDIRSNRRRTDALADLGEIVLELIRQGEIDLDELPEARAIVRQLDDMDGADDHDHHHHHHDDDHDHHHDHDHDHDHDHHHHRGDDRPRARPTLPERPAARNDRPAARSDRRSADDDELAAAIRPATRQRFDDRPAPSSRRADEDGTVSSARWAPPKRATPAPPRVWRPPVDELPRDDDHDEPARAAETPSRRMPPHPHRKGGGGIRFEDDDEDLERYMHPDDVPPKGPPEDS